MNLSNIITSKYLYPLWRVGWIEKAFFRLCRLLDKGRKTLFDFGFFGFDVSYYQAAINFQTMKDYGAKFVILRCGYAARKDLRFDEYMQTSPLYLPVRVYHYYDPTISPTEQANSVIATLSQYNLRGTRVWMDFEFTWAGGYSSPNHWKIYRDMLRQAGYKTGVYTRATWWDSRVGTLAAEFATDPVWAAQYNTSLNLVPKGWSKAMIWQQGTPSIGIAAGVSSKEIDYNLWNTEYNFADEWGVVQPPPALETVTELFNGVRQIAGARYGWKYWLTVINPQAVRYEVVHPQPLNTVSNIAKARGAKLAWNGGEWDRLTGLPKDYSVSGGSIYIARKNAVPSFMVTNTGLAIDHVNRNGVTQAISGLRYLIRDGVIQSYLNGSEPQYTEGHSRSVDGLTADGRHIRMTSEGVYPNQGLTLKQAAQIMFDHGAVIAFDEGGGGDTTYAVDGKVVNVTEDIDAGVHVERRIPQILLAYPIGGSGMYKYDAKALGDGLRLRPNHNVNDPYLATYPKDTVFSGDLLWIAPADGLNVKAGDTWLEVKAVGGVAKSGWVAVKHMGVAYCALTENAAPSGDIAIDMTLKADGTITGSWTNV